MSELIQKNDNRATIRRKLLAGVSALALTAYVSSSGMVSAEDTAQPQIWIELGGQLEQLSDSQEALSPPFLSSISNPNLHSVLNIQQPPSYALDEQGKISFQPNDSDWIFSASIRYGRSRVDRNRQHLTPNKVIHITLPTVLVYYPSATSYKYHRQKYPAAHAKFAEGSMRQSETHAILDFQAGKDVGLGLFRHGSSTISAGIRFAQFSSQSDVKLRAEPDVQYPTAPITKIAAFAKFVSYGVYHFHDYAATASIRRSFSGVGPSLTWAASTALAGNPASMEITLDWGANAAVLFGRQKTRGHHQTTVETFYVQGFHAEDFTVLNGAQPGAFNVRSDIRHAYPVNLNRSRTAVVPNLGGFAGLSFRYADAKVSFGYRADMFFGAMDGGIDTRKEENRGFFGPYASISIGIGD